ncbi:MAG: toll/interleukin-1 receptor domain-containing protein [Nitrospira sp.]|jgi:hypothetical protein
MPSYKADSAWLACNFQVWPIIDDLLTSIYDGSGTVSYQISFAPLTIARPSWLEIRRNINLLHDVPGMPGPLLTYHDQLIERLSHARFMCEEFVGVSSKEAAEQAALVLDMKFRKAWACYKFATPDFQFVQEEFDEYLNTGLHSGTFHDMAPDEICNAAMTEDEIISVVNMKPVGIVIASLTNGASSVTVVPQDPSAVPDTQMALPDPCESSDDYVFVSYKRDDIALMAPILGALSEMGYKIWYDRGIPGGAEWDSVIEARITNSRLLLLCVSQKSIRSKYVRREVKFADSLNKPVLAVMLEDTQLGWGMGMLLGQYQTLDLGDENFRTSLEEALAYCGFVRK